MHRFVCLVVVLCVMPSLRAAEENWPRWRGPDMTGYSPDGDPPIQYDEKTNIKWKTPIPGRGSSTPVIWGDQIFLLTAIDTGKEADPKDIPKPDPKFQTKTDPPKHYFQFVVVCVDRATGKIRWQQTAAEKVPHEGHHPTHSYAAFSPVTDGKHLYVSFGSQGVYCFDLDGKLKWKRDLGRMHTRLGWGEGSSPALDGDTLVVNWDQETGSFIVALDAKTGETIWKMDRDEVTSWATPVIVEHKGRKQVIVNGATRVRGYDLATGKVIWECGGQTINAIPTPIVTNGMAICMSGYKGSAVFAIPLDSTGDITGKAAWHYDRNTPYVPSPMLMNGRLYFTQLNTAILTCLDATTGKPVLEKERLPGLTNIYGSPVGCKDRIYLVGRDGKGLVFKVTDKLEVLARTQVDEGVDASPAIVGKQLFQRGEKHLYCVGQ
jgi:outer membrane protein assembly factor BamB